MTAKVVKGWGLGKPRFINENMHDLITHTLYSSHGCMFFQTGLFL
jgi:hypothetical protein